MRLAAVLRKNPSLQQMIFPGGPVLSAEFSGDGTTILTASGTNLIGVWTREATQIATFVHEGGERPVASFSPDGQKIFSRNGNSVKVWTTSGELISTIVHSNLVQAAYSSECVATADSNGRIILWRAKTGEKFAEANAEGTVSMMNFARDGKRLMTALRNGAVAIRDAATGEIQVSWKARGDLRHAAFNSSGDRVITAHSTGEARVWDARTGAAISPPMKESSWVTHAAFSPNGNYVALSTGGDAAKIRDATSGTELAELAGHKNVALAAVFNSDGSKIATFSVDGTARIFNATNGAPVSPLLWHGAVVTAVAFDSSSNTLLTASADGAVRVWDLAYDSTKESQNKPGPPSDQRPFDQLNAYVQAMTAHRIDRTGVFAPMEPKKLEAAWKIAQRASQK
jgi:WD40 repeat protein